jgi:hypothetical protein
MQDVLLTLSHHLSSRVDQPCHSACVQDWVPQSRALHLRRQKVKDKRGPGGAGVGSRGVCSGKARGLAGGGGRVAQAAGASDAHQEQLEARMFGVGDSTRCPASQLLPMSALLTAWPAGYHRKDE